MFLSVLRGSGLKKTKPGRQQTKFKTEKTGQKQQRSTEQKHSVVFTNSPYHTFILENNHNCKSQQFEMLWQTYLSQQNS